MLPEITQTILRAKSAKNLTFAELADRSAATRYSWPRPATARPVSVTNRPSSCSKPWIWTRSICLTSPTSPSRGD